MVNIRQASPHDIPTIARHRAAMFADMGTLPAPLADTLVSRTVAYLGHAMPLGEYVGWLAEPVDEPGRVVAGAGVQLRRTLPHPITNAGHADVASGRQGIVLNVYTDPAWRRRGIARQLMDHVLDWARRSAIDTLVLHASAEGKGLYQAIGFVSTNEMRFSGSLSVRLAQGDPPTPV